MRVGHDLAQAVHGHVEVVHPLPLAAVDLQADGLQLVLGEQLAVLLGEHLEGQRVVVVVAREAAQVGGDVVGGVALRGGHRARETVHRFLHGRQEDALHVGGSGS